MKALPYTKMLVFFGALMLIAGVALPLFAQTNQSIPLLTPLPEAGIGDKLPLDGDFVTYIQKLFNIFLGLAIVLSVIMVVIGGAQYLSTDAVGGKSEGKQKLQNALWGLVIALSAFLILNTINPDLLNLRLFQGVSSRGGTTQTSGSQTSTGNQQPENTRINLPASSTLPVVPSGATACPDACAEITGVPLRTSPKPCGGSGACMLHVRTIEKLRNLNSRLIGEGFSAWQVTEAWPPTVTHQNQCHTRGTCVDANFTGSTISVTCGTARSGANAQKINSIANAAHVVGLRAVYEVKCELRRQELIGFGVPPTRVLTVTAITAEHFSIYNDSI